MEWNKVMNFGDPSTFGTEMADRFVASGANLPPPVSNRVKKEFDSSLESPKQLKKTWQSKFANLYGCVLSLY